MNLFRTVHVLFDITSLITKWIVSTPFPKDARLFTIAAISYTSVVVRRIMRHSNERENRPGKMRDVQSLGFCLADTSLGNANIARLLLPGKIASITDGSGNTIDLARDIMDRVTTITYSGTSDQVSLSYDNAGRVVSMTDNRLSSTNLGGQTFQWGYDLADRMTTETYPDGNTIAYNFDSLEK